MSQYIQSLRSTLGDAANGKSDEELITLVAQSTGRNPAEVADNYRAMPTNNGQWGNRMAGSVDSYQANLYDVGRAAAGAVGLPGVSGWMDRQRGANSAQAEIERARAQNQGAVMSYKDVGGIGDAANYVGGLAVDSAPYLGEALVGGAVTGLAVRGASVGVRAAGAAAASYPSAVGDIMSNQRQQSGVTDDAAAAMYGVPYAALNAVSPVERMAAGRSLTRNAIDLLDSGTGWKGALARTGASAGKAAVGEGLNEVGQEVFNQAGRMAVDPNAGLMDPAALDRYGESFIGGAALGGVAGGLGGWRRSENYGKPPVSNDPNTPTDLLDPRPAFALQSYGPADGPMVAQPTQEVAPEPYADPRQMGLFSGVYENVGGLPTELTSDELNQNMLPYTPTDMTPADPTTSLGAAPAGLPTAQPAFDAGIPGEQANIFGGYDLPNDPVAPGQNREDAGMSAPGQRDMFAEKPTAAVQTDFSLQNVRRALMGNERADTHQTVGAEAKGKKPIAGKMDTWTAKFSKSLADAMASPAERDDIIAKAEEDVMVFDGSRATYDRREMAVNEAKRLAALYDQRMLDAQVQEGVSQAKPGAKVVSPVAAEVMAADSTNVVRQEGQRAMGELRQEADLESTDNRVAAARLLQSDQTRGEILDRVLNDPQTRNPLSRFHAELKRAGVTDLNIRPEEVERVDRAEDAKAGLTQVDAIPSTPNELDVYGTDTKGRAGVPTGVAERGGSLRSGDDRAGMGGTGRGASLSERDGGSAEAPVAGDGAPVPARAERTADAVSSEIGGLFPGKDLSSRVTVVQSAAELPENIRKAAEAGRGTKAVTVAGSKVYMIADAIEPGAARSVLMHELGVHVGMKPDMVRRLSEQVLNWTKRSDSVGAMAREAVRDAASSASTDTSDEVVAYMVERLVNSGVNPSDVKPTTPVGQFLKLIYNALKQAARAIGLTGDITPQDVVDFAYGAAGAALAADTNSTPSIKLSEANPYLPDPKKMPAFAAMWGDTLGGWRAHPGLLGWYTNRQLGEKFPFAKKIADSIGRMSARAKSLMAESHAVDLAWGALTNEKAQELHKAMIESTMSDMHIVDPLSSPDNPIFPKITYENGKPVWGDARSRDLNGHVVLADNGNLAKFKKLREQFKALDKDQLAVYLNAQKKLRADFDAHNVLFKKNVAKAYESGLARYMSDPRSNPAFGGNSAEQLANLSRTEQRAMVRKPEWQRLSKVARKDVLAMWHDVNTQEERTSQMRGPYFPLTRFGDHIITLKSARYVAAQERIAEIQKQLEVISTLDTDTPEQQTLLEASLADKREELKKARESLDALRDNPNDYQVEFFEKRAEAIAREKFVREEWIPGNPARADMVVDRILRTQYNSSLDSMSEGFVNKLEEQLAGGLPPSQVAEIRTALRSIYLQQLPDRSALKSMLKRQNVAGVKTAEMRRSFASATLRNAWRLSRLEHSNDIKSAIDELRQSRGEDDRIVGDEFGKRFLTSLQMDEEKPYLDALANAGYIWHLAASPAYLLTNLTQPWTISLPMMAARAGGPGRAAAQLTTATQQVVKNMMAAAKKDGARFEVNLDGEEFTQGERDMLKNLLNQGLIDVTLEHDLGNVAKGKEETIGGKIMRYAGWPAHQTEVVNRVSTALAAYRIALDKPGTSMAEATSYAEDIVASTQFDYSAENAARHMRPGSLGGLGRLVFQFKKYTQAMVYLIGSNAKKAFNGDKDAAKSLAYLMGFQFAVTGLVGVPMAPLATLISKALATAWDDDDEPEFYQLAYAGIKDAVGETAARAIMKGLPAAAGLDLSGSMGQQGLLNPFAFANTQGKTGADWAAAMMFSLAGPAPALLAKGFDSARALQEGDPMKAAQLALPRTASAVVKAIDMHQRGITDKRGQTLMSPDEVGGGDAVLRSLGFQATAVGDMYDARNAFYNSKAAAGDVRKRLLRDMVRARDSGEDATSIREDITEFNSRHPNVQIKPKDVNAAIQEARKAAREMKGGVRVRKQDQALATELGLTGQ